MLRESGHVWLSPRRAAVVLLLVLLHLVAAANAASAHADLEASSPAAGSQVSAAPAAVTLQFSEAVSLVSRSVVVLDEQGARVDAADAQHPGGDRALVTATVRAGLPAGTYTVLWRVVSDDSHPVSGTFTFGVRVVPKAPATVDSPADPVVTGLHWLAELAALGGVVVLAGSAFFVVWLWREGRGSLRARRVLGVSLVAALVGNALLLVVDGAYGAGGTAAGLLDLGTMSTTLATTSGRLTALRLAVLLAAFLWWRHQDRAGELPSRLDVFGLWLVVAVTLAVGGHAGHSTSPLLTSLVDVAHLTAVSMWVGGLVLLGVAHLRDRDGDLARLTVLPRWSRFAAGAVAAIVLTGAASALVQVGSWGALVGTAYGRLVVAKVALLLVVLVVAAGSRRMVAGVVRGVTTRTLSRLVAAETLGAVVILGLSAALVSTQPGRESYLPAMSTTVTAQGGSFAGPAAVRLHITVRPTTPGFEGLTVSAASADGAPLAIQAARLRFVNVEQHLGPMEYPVRSTSGAVDDVLISVPAMGRWDVGLTLQIRGTWVTGAFSYDVGG